MTKLEKFTLRCSCCMTWAFIAWIIYLRPELYIKDLKLYINSQVVTLSVVVFLLGWIFIKPFKGLCSDYFSRVLWNLLPVWIVLSMFVVAEHFTVLSLIVTSLTVFAILYYRLLIYLGDEQRSERRYIAACKAQAKAIGYYTVMAVFFCTAVFSDYFLTAPSDNSYSGDIKYSGEVFGDKALFEKYHDTLLLLEPDTWSRLKNEDKLYVLQTVVNIESERLTVAAPEIVEANLEYGVQGQYRNNTHKIYIDTEYLSETDSDDCIETVGHEVRHSYQYHVVRSLDWSNEMVQTSYFYSDARDWKLNFENYISGNTSYEEYYYQPIEADARSYGKYCVLHYEDYLNPDE